MPFNCSSASSRQSANPSQTRPHQPQKQQSQPQQEQRQQQQKYSIHRTNPSASESHDHLLPNAHPPAISPSTYSGRPRSITSSIYSDASTIIATPQTSSSYRGFPSREAYMSALEDFIESKMYMSSHTRTLTGFYGPETMEDVIATRPDVEFGWQKRRRARKAEKAQQRRRTLTTEEQAGMEVLPEEEDQHQHQHQQHKQQDQPTTRVEMGGANNEASAEVAGAGASVQRVGRMGRLSRVFSGGSGSGRGRRATVV